MKYLTQMSPAIPTLRQVKESVNSQFSTIKARGKHHGAPDKELDVANLAKAYIESDIYVETPGRRIKMTGDRAEDYISKGMSHLLESNAVPDWFARRTYERESTEDWSKEDELTVD